MIIEKNIKILSINLDINEEDEGIIDQLEMDEEGIGINTEIILMLAFAMQAKTQILNMKKWRL